MPQSAAARYGMMVLTVGLAVVMAWLVAPLANGLPIEILFTAVILCLWFGGLGPGLIAIGLVAVTIDFLFLPPIHSLDFKPSDLVRLAIFSVLAMIVYFLAAARDRLADRLSLAASEMAHASDVQGRLFPEPPAVPGFDFGARCHPVGATGGDYFDFFRRQGEAVRFALGDVCGHGLGPALLAATVRAYLRVVPLLHDEPAEVLTLVNGMVCEDTQEEFITLFFGRIDLMTRCLTFASAGHPGYILSPQGEVVTLNGTGPPLGVSTPRDYVAGPAHVLEDGQMVLLLSDGILEALSPAGARFGLPRALDVARANRDHSATTIADALCQAALTFSGAGNQKDDITALVIKVLRTNEG